MTLTEQFSPELFTPSRTEQMLELSSNPQYIIDWNPMATPRPRTRIMMIKNAGIKWNNLSNKSLVNAMKFFFVNVYSDSKYDKYKKNLVILIGNIRPKIEPYAYRSLVATFYLPWPKSTPKKYLIEGAPHHNKPDTDNLFKGLSDALEDAGIVPNDSCISEIFISKKYTTNKNGRIEFSLLK